MKTKAEQRRGDLARIHIAKKWAEENVPRWGDADYRQEVGRIMDRLSMHKSLPVSSASLEENGRKLLIQYFVDLGWPARSGRRSRYTGRGKKGYAAHLTQEQADEIARLERALRWQGNPKRLQGFIERQTGKRTFVSALTNREASKVITGLRKFANTQKQSLNNGKTDRR